MQKKICTILDEKILSQAKTFCLEHHTTLNRLLEDAIAEYLQKKKKKVSKFSGVEASFGILKLPPKTLKTILQDDIYETE